MNFIKFKLLLILSVFILGPHYVNADHHEKIKILYMGGRDHDWKGYYESIVPLFKKQEDFELIFSNKLDDLKAENIKKYDVVLFFLRGYVTEIIHNCHQLPTFKFYTKMNCDTCSA